MGGEKFLKRLKFDPTNPPQHVYFFPVLNRKRRITTLTVGKKYEVIRLNTLGDETGASARSVKVKNDVGTITHYAGCNFSLTQPST